MMKGIAVPTTRIFPAVPQIEETGMVPITMITGEGGVALVVVGGGTWEIKTPPPAGRDEDLAATGKPTTTANSGPTREVVAGNSEEETEEVGVAPTTAVTTATQQIEAYRTPETWRAALGVRTWWHVCKRVSLSCHLRRSRSAGT